MSERWKALIASIGIVALGCATPETSPPRREAAAIEKPPTVRKFFTLSAENFWRLELPNGKEFDASGLIFDNKSLLVVNDKSPGLYRIVPGPGNHAELEATDIFTTRQLQPLLPERRSFDLEGLARDESGRLYACEEATRSIFRFDPATRAVERLAIDWTPVEEYFNKTDPNASFEGIAIGNGKLWVANERERARIIEVDLQSLKVTGDFSALPASWGIVLHYSDLAWRDGHLFVLLRHHRVILEVDSFTREVLAEYDYRSVEDAPEHLYRKDLPTGVMEGLAVDDSYFWLVTDNNGYARRQDANDRRPTLFKCPRPNK